MYDGSRSASAASTLAGIGSARDVTDEAFVAGAVFAGDHDRLLHAVECGQGGLDVAEFDAVAADLDLFVGAAEVLQLAVGTPAHQVPGAIHPVPRLPERARHEARRGQAGPLPISGCHTGAGHIQLTDHTGGHWAQPLVEDKRAAPGTGDPIGTTPEPAVNGALIAA